MRALVTGASSGIGVAFAERLARDGWDLVLVARRRDRLEDLAARLGSGATVLVADLADADSLASVEEAARDVDLLINNAGFGAYQAFVELDPAVADDLIDVHIRAVVRVTRAALPGMIARGNGGVITIASLLAFSGTVTGPLPQRAVYAGAKSFQVTFTQVLAAELEGTGVRVSVCCPGVVATEFHDVQGMDMSKMPRMSASDVAQAALTALANGEVLCAPGLEDPALLEAIGAAQRSVMAATRAPTLASRYKE